MWRANANITFVSRAQKKMRTAALLTEENLRDVNAVIDFTSAALRACEHRSLRQSRQEHGRGHHRLVSKISTAFTSWSSEHRTGFVYAANFSVGVNLFFEIARTAAAALRHDYSGQIFERHHVHKKDAPSGTAIAIQNVIREAADKKEDLEITSFREGEVVGLHEVVFESPADRIYLATTPNRAADSPKGAVRAAEWLPGKKGFYDFKDVWREL